MKTVEENIFPVCSYGRAENNFYHSKHALCARDLEIYDIVQIAQNSESCLFPSHLLDRVDHVYLLERLPELNKTPRLLVALGREFEEQKNKIMQAHKLGWAVDILVDRSLVPENLPSELALLKNKRWIVSPLHFFNVLEVVNSIIKIAGEEQVLVTFLEPQEKKSMLCNPDEVTYWKLRMEEEILGHPNVRILVLRTPEQKPQSFYYDPSLGRYRENFIEYGNLKFLRRLALYSQGLILHFTGMTLMLQDPKHFFYHKVQPPFERFLLNFTPTALRLRGRDFLRRVRFFVEKIQLFLKRRIWKIKRLWGQIRYQVFPVIFWPLYKLYWMSEYQYKTRILPLFKKNREL